MVTFDPKQPAEKLDYSIDFVDRLGGAAISSITSVTAIRRDTGASAAGFVSASPAPAISGTKIVFWLEDGLDGIDYKVTLKVVAADGKSLEEDAFISVREV